MQISQQLVQNLNKNLQEVRNCRLITEKRKLDTILSQVNASQNSQQTIGYTHWLSSFS